MINHRQIDNAVPVVIPRRQVHRSGGHPNIHRCTQADWGEVHLHRRSGHNHGIGTNHSG
ncbi:MAG: hypothetical protein ACK56I_17085 [bacterium]